MSTTRLLNLPPDILRMIIRMLNTSDFRLSLTCKILNRLFHEDFYQEYWKHVVKMTSPRTNIIGNINWAKHCHFRNMQRYADLSITAAELCRLIESNDVVSAMMWPCNFADIIQGGTRSPLLKAHQAKMIPLLKRFYQIATQQYQINQNNYSLLHLAVYCHQEPAVIKLRIEQGDDVNGKTSLQNSPLHIASYSGQCDTILMLLEYKAELETYNLKKHSPLLAAISSKHEQIVLTLLNAGARKHPVYNDVIPALLHAIIEYPDIVSILLSNGAHPETYFHFESKELYALPITDPELDQIRNEHINRLRNQRLYQEQYVTAIQLATMLGQKHTVYLLDKAINERQNSKLNH